MSFLKSESVYMTNCIKIGAQLGKHGMFNGSQATVCLWLFGNRHLFMQIIFNLPNTHIRIHIYKY